MTITREFKLCLNAGTASAPFINVNQYDEGEEWYFSLYHEDGSSYTPSSGAIIGLKADNNAILNAGTVVAGKVLITETQQMTAAAGRAIYELLIDGETHGTANFIVNVERRPSDDAEFSDSDLSMLQEAIDAAEVINEILDEGGDPSEIITENVNAWLDNHPEATTTVQDGAITAPKINNSLWDKILVNEEASGNPASFDDGADDVPVSSLKVNLEPVQTGSGDPSPSNVRPIYPANGKNMIPVAWTTETKNGVTATANADGTVSLTGTATANATFYVETTYTPSEDMRMTGCPSGGSSSTYVLWARTSANAYINDYGNGVTIPSGTSVTRFAIVVINGQTVNNLVFKPMICPVSITDASYQPYQGIMVERCGKNLAESKLEGMNIFGAGQINTDANYWLYYGKVKQGVVYTITSDDASGFVGGFFASEPHQGSVSYNGQRIVQTAKTVTAPIDGYLLFRTNAGFTNGQIEVGTTASDYEPYIGTSYPISLGREVYGGTVDLATGVLTLTKGFKNITASDSIQSVGASGNGWQVLRSSFDIPPLNTGANYSDGVICDMLKSEVGASSVADDLCFINSSGVLRFNTTTVYADKTALFNALGQINVAYPIEPQTHQLTPTQVKTLLGYNNISSTGTVDVIYHADTKLYIDKKIGELS